MKKVMLVFGTRPEAIKMAPLVKEFQKQKERVETVVCVTGQHREMLDQVLEIFGIKPDYDLNIMKQGQDLYDVTARVLTGMRDVLKEERPDVGLVNIKDSETGEVAWVDTSSRKMRIAYEDWFRNMEQTSSRMFMKYNVDKVSIALDEDYVRGLMSLFKNR